MKTIKPRLGLGRFLNLRMIRCSLVCRNSNTVPNIIYVDTTIIPPYIMVLRHRVLKYMPLILEYKRWRARTHDGRPTSHRGSWEINSTLPDKNCVEELFYYTILPSTISPLHHCRISMKYVSTKIIYHERIFHEMIFHEMQENQDEEKESKPRLLILSVGRIARQELLNISAD